MKSQFICILYNLHFVNYHFENTKPFNTNDHSALFPYLAPLMDVSVSKKRNIPAVSGGYSKSNAQEYRKNRVNIVGSYKPFLLKSLDGIPSNIKKRIAILVCKTIELFGVPPELQGEDTHCTSERESMRLKFWISLGMERNDPNYKFFQIEGFSFISEFMINFHCDTSNDSAPSSDLTYSLKSSVLITASLAAIPTVKVMMKRFGLETGQQLPVSLMLYRRKCVIDYCTRYSKRMSYGTDAPDVRHPSNLVTKAVLDALHDIEAPTNYSSLWDHDDCWEKLITEIENATAHVVENGILPQCRARCHTTVPSYDKMVRKLMLKCIYDNQFHISY